MKGVADRAGSHAAASTSAAVCVDRPLRPCAWSPAGRQASKAARIAAASIVVASIAWGAMPAGPAAAEAEAWIQPCRPRTSCVSTASFMQPAQYLSPWVFAPQDPAAATRALLHELEQRGGHVSVPEGAPAGRLEASLPTGLPATRDAVRFELRPDGLVLFRSEAQGGAASAPDPPFCLRRGCVSGPGNRGRLEELRDALGWGEQEAGDDQKQWVQILLH